MKKISLLTIIFSTGLSVLFLIPSLYFILEPSVARAVTDNVVVSLTVDSGITISDGADVTMAPNIGLTTNGSIGDSSWTVKTNDGNGYTLAVKASTSPALQSATSSFADYTEASAGVPELWSVGSGDKEFGYSAYGTDSSTATWGTSASCGSAGTPAAAEKYVGFTTSDKTIATRTSVTPVAGIDTTICFAAEQNGVYADQGAYTATITATATVL